MKKLFVLFVALTATLALSSGAFAIITTQMTSANQLAQLLGGSGVTITNATFTGANVAAGTFTGGNASGLAIDQGVVLTSGFVSNVTSVNTDTGVTGVNNMPGDAQLDALAGASTYDAAVLGFDFTTNGDAAYFNYVFGSDEYTEYVNKGFNDVFGFFVNGTNYALLPGGAAVGVDTVNHLVNTAYYNANENGEHAFEYDGFTTMLTTSITGLTAGQTYHIDLKIADSGDDILDSGVFLQAGSFSDTDPSIPEPGTMLLLGSGLLGLVGFRKKD